MRATMMPFPLTLDAVLRRAEALFPAVELVEGETRICYSAFCQRVRRLARGLRAAGLQPGDRVATLLWNRMPHLEAYFAVPLAGAIVHPLNLRLHPGQVAQIVRHAGDRFILLEAGQAERWREIAPHCHPVRALLFPDDWNALADADAQDALPPLGEDDGAAMGYTSGTTGDPKGVVYSHRALLLHALATALPDAMNLRASDCVMPLVPMFHANAWGIPYTAALLGCKQVLCGAQFGAEAALDLLAAEQVTFSAGVGAIWQTVLDAYEREPGRWKLHSGLRVNLGGAPAPPSLFRQFDRVGIAVNMGWGMTEMTPVGTMNPHCAPAPSESEHARRARQGRPLPLVETRTAPDGELEVRGPWVTGSYVGGSNTEAFTEDGWFKTGDVVQFDEEGLMAIVDRNKDLIRSGGEWISSVALENALAGLDGIREAAVIAVPHPRWQERPLALVVLREGAEAQPEAWRRGLEKLFPAWQCPDAFEAVPELPRTATGKLDKRVLRAQYANRRA